MRLFCLILIMVVASVKSHAQNVWLTGVLRDSITHFPVKGAMVNNTTRKQQVQTDSKGIFRLRANPGDLIQATAPDYHATILPVPSLFADNIEIFLAPTGVTLENVTVRSNYTKYQLDSTERRRTFEELRGTPVRTVSRPNSGAFGVGINLDRVFKQKQREQEKKEETFQRREKEAYIDSRFSPHLVAQYTGLKGDALRQFIYEHRPTYQWLREHQKNEEVLFYINEEVKKFRKTQAEF